LEYFNEYGRRANSNKYRVFGKNPSYYYKLKQRDINYNELIKNFKEFGIINDDINYIEYESRSEELKSKIEKDVYYNKLLNGMSVPFLYKNINKNQDLGEDLNNNLLNSVEKSFKKKFPESKFRAILQNKSTLEKKISIEKRSKYENFVELSNKNYVLGWYFPQTLQEFDIESQRRQMNELPSPGNFHLCLSGGKDICASIVGIPDLLINDEDYAPILCLSSYVHEDDRMVLTLKSYGPHMEFWSMTQMLRANVTQVSEQWAGGITIFEIF
jgi:hypothetical protein